MSTFSRFALALCVTLGLVGSATADDRGTKEEARAMADSAWDHIKQVGLEKACQDFTNDKANWNKKDLYVIVRDGKGVTLAHGASEKLVGKEMLHTKDANGVAFVEDALNTVNSKGSGWVDYDWPNPLSHKVEAKSTYVRKLPTSDGYIGVGFYR